jgi:ribosomal protein S18 acetylase RimI-like enzyme
VNKKINIRKATSEDIPDLLALITELAVFEKAPNEVINTPELMKKDGFGEKPIFDAFVAETDGLVIGMAITYFRYSTWKGKRLYLEDLIVTEKSRGLGAGQLLFQQCIQFGKESECNGMVWQVLDWNEPAIDFYKSYNSHLDGGWINGTLEF